MPAKTGLGRPNLDVAPGGGRIQEDGSVVRSQAMGDGKEDHRAGQCRNTPGRGRGKAVNAAVAEGRRGRNGRGVPGRSRGDPEGDPADARASDRSGKAAVRCRWPPRSMPRKARSLIRNSGLEMHAPANTGHLRHRAMKGLRAGIITGTGCRSIIRQRSCRKSEGGGAGRKR